MGLSTEQLAQIRYLYRVVGVSVEEIAHRFRINERTVTHVLGIRPAPFNMHLELEA